MTGLSIMDCSTKSSLQERTVLRSLKLRPSPIFLTFNEKLINYFQTGLNNIERQEVISKGF